MEATSMVVAAGGVVVDYASIASAAAKRAVGGGSSGALAGVVQVLSLMWLRTAMNYEYRYGGEGMVSTVRKLFEEGGIPRLYRGVGFALVQSPLSRFGDAGANAAVPALLASLAEAGVVPALPLAASQAAASVAAASWRVAITPVDTVKTTLQVDGALDPLGQRIAEDGPLVLWRGAFTAAAATFVGNYPWFLTYNALDAAIPPTEGDMLLELTRRATLGVAASCASDVCSNSLRVIKTGVQTGGADGPIEYARSVWANEGPAGLFGRGLQTRLSVNCLQGAVFSVAWKYFERTLLVPSARG
ncbi:hypothetical protein CTAYLR_000354 [Chrysophaeum taylorii]|uniref:Mitochondrial carrier protein n=1 Tax=Chrysophaeum taylorii TaxID=2483200 RepID=A0AAD7UGS3_9STRA|nr:hypothetical protein CTAYLR_000354 [Chrysophaeum taylorii]